MHGSTLFNDLEYPPLHAVCTANSSYPVGYGENGYSTEPTVVYVTRDSPYTPLSGGDLPDDYMIMSILTLLFCFWPLSIVALVKSLEVQYSTGSLYCMDVLNLLEF